MHTGSVESRTAFHGSRDSEAPGLHMAAASAGLAHAGLQAVPGGVRMAVTQGGALSWAPRRAGSPGPFCVQTTQEAFLHHVFLSKRQSIVSNKNVTMHFLFATCNKTCDCSRKARREDAGVTQGGPPSTCRAAEGAAMS